MENLATIANCRQGGAEPAGRGNIVLRAMTGKIVNVQVTEYFLGYQCSISNMDWSPAVMFDAATPFLDVRMNYSDHDYDYGRRLVSGGG